MKKLLLAIAVLIVLNVNTVSADVIVNVVTDDTPWSDVRVTGGGTQQYDARSITFTNSSGLRLTELSFELGLTGTFDDTIALDLNGDSVIDWAVTQDDWYAIATNYTPWIDATPFTLEATVTQSGTTITAIWDGLQGTPGVGSVQGWDQVSSMTLADLGFGADGSITSDFFTTNEIRLGNLNQVGASGHGSTIVFPESAIRFAAVPEPGAIGVLGMCSIAVISRRRRRSGPATGKKIGA